MIKTIFSAFLVFVFLTNSAESNYIPQEKDGQPDTLAHLITGTWDIDSFRLDPASDSVYFYLAWLKDAHDMFKGHLVFNTDGTAQMNIIGDSAADFNWKLVDTNSRSAIEFFDSEHSLTTPIVSITEDRMVLEFPFEHGMVQLLYLHRRKE